MITKEHNDICVEVVENPDGSATLMLNITKEMRKKILNLTGKKRLTKKVLENFVIDSLKRYLKYF